VAYHRKSNLIKKKKKGTYGIKAIEQSRKGVAGEKDWFIYVPFAERRPRRTTQTRKKANMIAICRL